MSCLVCTGAILKCPFGAVPVPFNSLPIPRVLVGGMPAGVMTDIVPMLNVPTFGMCQSPANPMFIAATAAAMGVPTPVPCIPVPAGTWLSAEPKVQIGGQSALTADSKLMCAWAGEITVQFPGQITVMT